MEHFNARRGFALALLLTLALAPSCDDESSGGGGAETGENCMGSRDCRSGICTEDGRCRTVCRAEGTTCADGSTCFRANSIEGDPVNVCSQAGCTAGSCPGNSFCDVGRLRCVCRPGFLQDADGVCKLCLDENRDLDSCKWPYPDELCGCIDLRGRDLTEADLTLEDMRGAIFDRATFFPDDYDFVVSGMIGPGANLSGQDLSALVFTDSSAVNADFRQCVLQNADLSGTNLTNALFDGANLSGINLSEANLAGASFGGANLRGAKLLGADLTGANLAGADLSSADLTGARLGMATLDGANINGARFQDVEGPLPPWVQASIGGDGRASSDTLAAAIRNGNLDMAGEDALVGANLAGAQGLAGDEEALAGKNLAGANLSNSDLSGTNMAGSDVSGANLENAQMGGSNLEGATADGANMQGADLSEANLQDASAQGANLREA
ncbi:MAG: pentapeptide repeat-containing protein, partial [Myxococcales bacterium]|nr:pentapeptide repeat-containing protein [Myxococcales bacterium]